MLDGAAPVPAALAKRYRDAGYWVDKSLRDEFQRSFKQYATRVAVIDRDRVVTYNQLDELSSNLAMNLIAVGLQPLDRVVMQLPNVMESVVLYVALQKIGCIPVAALPSHRYTEVRDFAMTAKAKACVAPVIYNDFNYVDMIKRLCLDVPTLRYGIILGNPCPGLISLSELIERPALGNSSELTEINIDPTDPAILQLSGGTTGAAKLIPRTHNEYAYGSKVSAELCMIGSESVLLVVLPVAHNLPLATPGIQGVLFSGGSVVLSCSSKANDIFALIHKHGVTHLKVVPVLLIRLVNSLVASDYDLSSLRLIQSGGQRLQPAVKKAAKCAFPRVFIQENFGMSEGILLFVRQNDSERTWLETVGRPASPADEVRLCDEHGNEVLQGTIGEMCFRGPYSFGGYFAVPEYNAKCRTDDGFWRSGDLMRQDEDGNYIIQGRKKDLINRGGEKISTEEVENLILTHPSIQNVACVPIPDTELGEKMCACVILRDGCHVSLQELQSFLKEKEIAKYKYPELVQIFSEFPVSNIGKVSKQGLVESVKDRLLASCGK